MQLYFPWQPSVGALPGLQLLASPTHPTAVLWNYFGALEASAHIAMSQSHNRCPCALLPLHVNSWPLSTHSTHPKPVYKGNHKDMLGEYMQKD